MSRRRWVKVLRFGKYRASFHWLDSGEVSDGVPFRVPARFHQRAQAFLKLTLLRLAELGGHYLAQRGRARARSDVDVSVPTHCRRLSEVDVQLDMNFGEACLFKGAHQIPFRKV